MARTLLVRGLLTGLAAGLLAFAFAFVFGEPQVQHAIDFEDHLYAIQHLPPDPELVSRGVQRTLGLLTGTVVMGVALGGIFAMVFSWCYGRVGALGARATSALIAAGAFLAVTAVPATKYPPNPPTIGNPATIGRRTILYFAMIAISLLAFVAANRLWRQVRPRLGAWNASLLAGAAFLVVVVVAELILPAVHETPKTFPADVLWRFRIASLGINATLWTTIGLGFGALAERAINPRAKRVAATVAVEA